jgi:DNA-binding NtrC family response regulator
VGERRILVVEDEDITRVLYKRLLDRMPLRYDMVSTLKEARRLVSETARYELLVTDIRLPDGRGTDILDEFHKKYPKAKVLIITGSPHTASLGPPTPEIPGTEWIFKPFEIEEFTAALKRLLSL